jgi:hypothetical protein
MIFHSPPATAAAPAAPAASNTSLGTSATTPTARDVLGYGYPQSTLAVSLDNNGCSELVAKMMKRNLHALAIHLSIHMEATQTPFL